jgi:hypothetical protein
MLNRPSALERVPPAWRFMEMLAFERGALVSESLTTPLINPVCDRAQKLSDIAQTNKIQAFILSPCLIVLFKYEPFL